MTKMQVFQKLAVATTVGGALFSFQNCSNAYKLEAINAPSSLVESAGGGDNSDGTGTVSLPPASTTVCDPFGSSGGASANLGHGLAAQGLYYLTPDQTQSIAKFSDLVSNAKGFEDISLILSDVNVPNRYFTQGFATQAGDQLKASDGSTLTAYFGFTAQGFLTLGNLTEGDYQIAVLSDDGSVLTLQHAVKQASGEATDFVINNDGAHSMQMGCSKDVVHLDASSKIPLSFSYYQGPPVTIGLMIMIRPVPAGNVQDAQCGKGGPNDKYFFDDSVSAKPAVAQQPYLDLVSRGWTPISSANYLLPDALQTTTPICSN